MKSYYAAIALIILGLFIAILPRIFNFLGIWGLIGSFPVFLGVIAIIGNLILKGED